MKARLSLLYFIQFGVWGCYLTSFGQFLGSGGIGGMIAWFYAAIGLVSIITPSLLGRLADCTGRPERLSGVCLQISNGFVTPFITHFSGYAEYADSFASGNATMLFSLSQISEAVCILLVGVSLKWRGIRFVYAAGLLAWALRFLMLGAGNPGYGLWLLVGSMLVYGIAFNFITIAGHLYIQQVAPSDMKGFAQGLMMFMSNGVGATFGTIAAGSIVNHWCQWKM